VKNSQKNPNNQKSLKSEEEILEALNEITDGKVKEISLIYELGDYLKMERERDKMIKAMSKLKAKRNKIVKEGSDPKKMEDITKKQTKGLTELIKKVIEMHIFKQKFKQNPQAFYKSRRLFVTFKNFQIARNFKNLYNKQYRDGRGLLKMGSRAGTESQAQAKKTDNSPKQDFTSGAKLQRNEEKYVDVDNKIKYRGSTLPNIPKDKFKELAEKQKKFGGNTDSSNPDQKFYSERPKNFNKKMANELKRGFISKMMNFYSRSSTSEELLKMTKMRDVFGPNLILKRSLDPKYINWDYHSDSELGLIEIIIYSFAVLMVMPGVCYYLNYQYFKLDLM
jgi:hypothetical protein